MTEVVEKEKRDPATLPFPERLRDIKPPYRPGVTRVPVDRYFKQEYHDMEVERIWKRSWQWACREEEIPEIGDYHIYEVATLSFIVVRTGAQEFKAYWNSCPHRGRKLRDCDGKRADEFRCMFHGWAWSIEGRIKDMLFGEDFPGTGKEVSRLREVNTGLWGGFVFINPDPDCESLEDFLGEMPAHFADTKCNFDKRWKQVHVQAELAVNWKIAQEAFIEPWHVHATHPQQLGPVSIHPAGGERWDDYGNWMRNAPMFPGDPEGPTTSWMPVAETEQDFLDSFYDTPYAEGKRMLADQSRPAAEMTMANARETMRKTLGDAVDDYHDVHVAGYEMVHLWPNMHPWGGFSRLVYRFRPDGSNPERCVMDILLMSPWPEDRPRPAPSPVHRLKLGSPISDAPELGILAHIFLQDLGNMEAVQAGLRTSPNGYVILGNHNDAPVRHFQDLYEKWMGLEESIHTPLNGVEK